jgi:hypothetical protein
MVNDYRLRKISDYLGEINRLIADMEMNGFHEASDLLKEVKNILYDELDRELGVRREQPKQNNFDAYLVAHLYNMGLITED